MTITNTFDLDEISESQSDKFLTHNEDNRRLSAGIAGVFEYDFASNPSSYTLSTTEGEEEWRYRVMHFTDNGSPQLTSQTSIIFPATKNPPVVQILNNTSVNLFATVGGSPDRGAVIPPGEVRAVYKNPVTGDMDYADNMGRLYNTGEYDVATDADHTLPDDMAGNFAIYVHDNTPTLTAARTLTLPPGEYPGAHFIYNTSGYELTFKYTGDAGAGVPIPSGTGRWLVNAGPAFGLDYAIAAMDKQLANGQVMNIRDANGSGSPDEYSIDANNVGEFLKVNAQRLMVPNDTGFLDMDIRSVITGRYEGTGTLEIYADSSVTIDYPGGSVTGGVAGVISVQYGQFSLIRLAANHYTLEGRID